MTAAQDFYQRLFDADPDPIVVLDRMGRMLAANSAARALLNLDASAGCEFDLHRMGFLNEPFSEVIERVDRGGSATWEIETPAGAGTASQVLEVRLLRVPVAADEDDPDALEDPGSRAWAYLWAAHDVTDRVKLERARQDFVNMIVHDLRVPLGNILNSLDLVLSAWREQDMTIPVAQILEIGLRSAHRMEQLVSDILDSARLQARKRPLAVAEINVSQMVAEAVESVSASASRRNQKLRVSIEPHLPPMRGDPDLLGRVLVNLLANAVKYVQEGGEILLNVWTTADAFGFTVSDNGPGIAGEDQATVFELYSRGEAQRAKGAGVGLAYCRLAVNAHGGRIWLDSAKDQGASFSFTIPRVLPKSAVFHQETAI